MNMLITRKELCHLKSSKDYCAVIKEKIVTGVTYLRKIKETKITATFYYDLSENLYLHFKAYGYMVCPCALTMLDVEVPFSLDEEEKITFSEETLIKEDAYYLGNETSLEDILLHFLLPIIPIKVVKKGEIEYPKGDGWQVTTEAQLRDGQNKQKDLRWAKLWDLKNDREEQQ